MNILLLGAAGQLGRELRHALSPLGTVHTTTHATLDLADADALRTLLRTLHPDLVVNAAAYTAVDKAESDAAQAQAINADAPMLIAAEQHRRGARLIHYSTDYVFDGSGSTPWREGDATAPLNVYGRSKLAGEQAIVASGCRALILRTSWVFGLHGANFMNSMLRLAQTRSELGVVSDQFGAPTWTRHLAAASALLAARPEAQGIYHLCNSGETTWAGYAEALFSEAATLGLLSATPTVRPIGSADYPTPARRPQNSRLDCSALARDQSLTLPHWRSALTDCLADARFPARN